MLYFISYQKLLIFGMELSLQQAHCETSAAIAGHHNFEDIEFISSYFFLIIIFISKIKQLFNFYRIFYTKTK